MQSTAFLEAIYGPDHLYDAYKELPMLTTEHKHEPKVAAVHKVRCNVKSLAAEARIIRHEEARCGSAYRAELAAHRRGRLRDEARYAHLALAYIRGRSYRTVEHKAEPPRAQRLAEKINRYMAYSDRVSEAQVAKWLKG